MLRPNDDKGILPNNRTIAYFSMEIALDPAMPTYSGGLGVLAADTIRSAAHLKLPMVATTLLHRRGYFRQKLDPNGCQTEEPALWKVDELLEEIPTLDGWWLEGWIEGQTGWSIGDADESANGRERRTEDAEALC